MILLDAGARPASVSKPPTSWDYFADRAFRVMAQGAVWLIVLLLAYLLWSIGTKAWLGIREHGLEPTPRLLCATANEFRGRHKSIAKVAMGRRIAVRLYWMWRNGCEYSQSLEFGSYARQLGTGHGVN